jgi:hypothetical protein
MSDIKVKAKEKIEDAAEAARKVVDQLVAASKDAAHAAGKTIEKGGKRLRNA